MIHPQIKLLLILQEHDLAILRLEKELHRLPAEEAAIETRLKQQTQTLEKLRSDLRSKESECRQIELEVRSLQQQIQRYQIQQLQTRNNAEYQALTHEIEHAQKKIAELEDKELELLEAIEQCKQAVREEKQRVITYEKEAELARQNFQKKMANAQNMLEKEKELRNQSESAVNADVLALYRRILQSKKDIAVVPLRHQTCSGCHMKVVPQTAIDVRAAKKLVTCENCGRLLFDPE
ncbi:MAG: C4-type zinc ribbon domain-containing protein [Methylacidiphilales bacterium]|nr:C4-type zinc ribbon domain-containing protein [Candidatus Methylacidiphilales bacterium]MDW8349043.1 C4-type zinc ribbon domain-containing protein [Verrucomicrobiae bacterium]